ncbi:MAG: anaerobic ribonucleoside-triphosphate reductase activating protein [archaeon]
MIDVDIRGIFNTSLIDYPGKIVSTIFFNRCNFRCPFCHNPELALDKDQNNPIDTEKIIEHLIKRKKWLDGVCLTGGEPTLHKGLTEFIENIKKEGFLVKLDTNGTNPSVLKALIKKKQLDYIAMDIKTNLEDYENVAKVRVNKKDIKKSIGLIQNSTIDYEFRTTIVPPYFNKDNLINICEWLKESRLYVLQQFKNNTAMIDMTLSDVAPYPQKTIMEFKEIASKYFKNCEVRGI